MLKKKRVDIMSLKDNWKETGAGLGHAFKDLGKTIIKSAATGVKKVDEWANGEENEESAETKEQPTETEEND